MSLCKHGNDVFGIPKKLASNATWEQAMKIVVREMLLCEGVSLLPGWEESKGAAIERRLALELNMDTRERRFWNKREAHS